MYPCGVPVVDQFFRPEWKKRRNKNVTEATLMLRERFNLLNFVDGNDREQHPYSHGRLIFQTT